MTHVLFTLLLFGAPGVHSGDPVRSAAEPAAASSTELPRESAAASPVLSSLQAQSPSPWAGWYVGFSGGLTDAHTKGSEIDGDLNLAFSTNSTLDSTYFGWKLLGGYRFPTTPWSVELAYVDLGSLDTDIVAAPPNLRAFKNAVKSVYPPSGRGVELAGRYSYDFAQRFSASAKAGGWWWDSTAEFTTIQPPGGTRSTTSVGGSGIDLVLGAAFEVAIAEGFSGRLELERYWLDSHGEDLWSLGLIYTIQ